MYCLLKSTSCKEVRAWHVGQNPSSFDKLFVNCDPALCTIWTMGIWQKYFPGRGPVFEIGKFTNLPFQFSPSFHPLHCLSLVSNARPSPSYSFNVFSFPCDAGAGAHLQGRFICCENACYGSFCRLELCSTSLLCCCQ